MKEPALGRGRRTRVPRRFYGDDALLALIDDLIEQDHLQTTKKVPIPDSYNLVVIDLEYGQY